MFRNISKLSVLVLLVFGFLAGCSASKGPLKAKYIVKPYLLCEQSDWVTVICQKDGLMQMVQASIIPNQARHSLWRSADGGQTWSKIRDLPLNFSGSGGLGLNDLLVLQDGQWLLSGHRAVAELHNGGLPVVAFSTDNGQTWSEPKTIRDLSEDDVYYRINDRTIQLANGRIVIPAAHATDRNATEGATNEALLFFSDDNGKTWNKTPATAVPDTLRGMQEPCVVEMDDGRLMILARTGAGCHHRSYSSDGGQTWSKPQPTTLIAGCSPITLKKMPDGRLIVLYNHGLPPTSGDLFPRFPLHYAVSADNGQSWSQPVIVDDQPLPIDAAKKEQPKREFDYTSVCFLPRGIFLTYGDEVYRRKCCVIEYPK